MSVKNTWKAALVIGLGLSLAACSSDEKEVENEADSNTSALNQGSGSGSGDGTGSGDGRPNQVDNSTIKEEETEEVAKSPLEAAGNGQSGLNEYAGSLVYFPYDSSELSQEARDTLAKQAEWMKYYRNSRITIEGHCDERGTREYNLALGERRASAVKDYLVALGVSPSRIRTISYGKERPVVFGSGPEVWSQNRRGKTVIQ